ncbi:PTS sugar transporter subunit IIC [Dermabacteraceae bacterium P13115]|nr:PTS sugar transporter subunit IIC [Dermabacteraceae bacterium TAE3-ERU5]
MFDTPMTPKLFIDRVLNGAAVGIVVGLIPNAMTGQLWKFLYATFPSVELFNTLYQVVFGIQFTVPVIVGILIAMQFSMTSVQTVIVATASFVGSGALHFTEKGVMLKGIGDLINTMLTAAIAVLILAWVGNKLGSLTILFLPLIGGGISGFIGILTLPYVKYISSSIGDLVNKIAESTSLGAFASVLIAMIFAILIVSPISTVGIALAIGIDGAASGAANLGVAAAAAVLMVGSFRVNNAGVTWSVFLGAMKMMMGNIIKHPVMSLPLVTVAGITGLIGNYLNITGTPASAGFGQSGLVGPIAAAAGMGDTPAAMKVFILAMIYFVIPIALAVLFHWLFTSVLKIYSPEIYRFGTTDKPGKDEAEEADEALEAANGTAEPAKN